METRERTPTSIYKFVDWIRDSRVKNTPSETAPELRFEHRFTVTQLLGVPIWTQIQAWTFGGKGKWEGALVKTMNSALEREKWKWNLANWNLWFLPKNVGWWEWNISENDLQVSLWHVAKIGKFARADWETVWADSSIPVPWIFADPELLRTVSEWGQPYTHSS